MINIIFSPHLKAKKMFLYIWKLLTHLLKNPGDKEKNNREIVIENTIVKRQITFNMQIFEDTFKTEIGETF